MIGLANNSDFLPRDALNTGYCTDANIICLKQRALLNVQLDETMWNRTRARSIACVTNTNEFIAKAWAIYCIDIERFFGGHATYIHK